MASGVIHRPLTLTLSPADGGKGTGVWHTHARVVDPYSIATARRSRSNDGTAISRRLGLQQENVPQ